MQPDAPEAPAKPRSKSAREMGNLAAQRKGSNTRSWAEHRWHAGEFTASLPALLDEAWTVLAAGLPAPRR